MFNKIPPKSYFITGTDTHVGKSTTTGLLGKYFLDQGHKVITQKWIQTGTPNLPEDILTHHRIMETGPLKGELIKDICPYNFTFPAAPFVAAAEEGKTINPQIIYKSYHNLEIQYDIILVEGIGGALVPVTKELYIIDLVKELQLPIIIVSANKLGTINHTLLTIEAIRSRGLQIEGIIFKQIESDTNPKLLKTNVTTIQQFSNIPVLAEIPYI